MKQLIQRFIRQEGMTLLFLCIIFATIILIFFLFDLSKSALELLLWLLFIISIIYFAGRIIYQKEQRNLLAENEALKTQINTIKNNALQQQADTEAYFLMWVHQMKTPITASQLVLNQSSEQSANYLKQNMVEIENYTNMALHYLRLVNPDRDLTFTKVSLDAIIRPLIKKYRGQFIHQQVKLHYETINKSIVTEANLTSLMIEQILNNALKYTHNGDIWIQFDAQNMLLTIKDNGKGIREGDLPKIFDKGFSGFNGQLNDKSSGIGLYLVKTIATRLNQRITVTSTVNEGTTFTIYLHQHMPSIY